MLSALEAGEARRYEHELINMTRHVGHSNPAYRVEAMHFGGIVPFSMAFDFRLFVIPREQKDKDANK